MLQRLLTEAHKLHGVKSRERGSPKGRETCSPGEIIRHLTALKTKTLTILPFPTNFHSQILSERILNLRLELEGLEYYSVWQGLWLVQILLQENGGEKNITLKARESLGR